MKLMATYGTLRPIALHSNNLAVLQPNGERCNFTFSLYTESFFNHFKFRQEVDDHINLRYSPISLEESISTKDWWVRVFLFMLLALIEVNARLALAFFSTSPAMTSQLKFHCYLAKELIDYSSCSLDRGGRATRKRGSGLLS